MISLDVLPLCTPAVVVSLPSGRVLAHRLLSLGINPGSEIECIHNRGKGPLIVQVHGARLALGRRQAARIMVKPRPEAEHLIRECRPRRRGRPHHRRRHGEHH